MRKTLAATAVAVALGSVVPAAHAFQAALFDPDGPGSSFSAILVKEFSHAAGNVILDNLFEGARSGFIVSQTQITGASDPDGNPNMPTSSALGGRIFTYQFVLPVDASVSGDSRTYSISAGKKGTFAIFTDSANNINTSAGSGYGNLGTSVLANGETAPGTMIKILQGEINATSTAGTNYDGVTVSNLGTNTSGIGTTIATRKYNGSLSFDIFITSQNTSWFNNDMTGAAIIADLQFEGSLSAPVQSMIVSQNVVGVSAYFGAAEATAVGTKPLNDNECFDPNNEDATGPCDIQLRSSSTTTFLSEVPEPTSLALLGLGLGAFGVAARRRRGTR